MFLIVGLMAFMIMPIQKVLSQNNITFAKDTIDPLQCERTLELRCTYFGALSCCTSSNRIWRVNGQPVMTNGIVSSGEGKYQEGKISDKYFILIINNLEKADLDKSYSCKYGFDDLKDSVVLRKSCNRLYGGMEAIGFLAEGTGICGAVVSFVIVIIIIIKRKHVKINQVRNRLAVALPVFLAMSFFLNFLIAGPVGTYENYGIWLIAVGLGTGIVGIAVGYMFDKIGMSDTDSQQTWPPWVKVKEGAKFVPLLILTAAEIIIIGVVVLIVIGKYFKGQCNQCGGIAFGWAILGPLVPVIVFIILKLKKGLNLKRSILFGCLIFWRSLVVNVVVAVSFGIYLCPCTDYKDVAFICVGLFYSLILIAVFWCLFDTEEDKLLIVLLFFGGLEICLAIFFCVAYCKSSKANSAKEIKKDNKLDGAAEAVNL